MHHMMGDITRDTTSTYGQVAFGSLLIDTYAPTVRDAGVEDIENFLVDEVLMWDEALTADQISDLYDYYS